MTEGNEWYSNDAANTSAPKTSVTRVVGIRYVYNVCDTALPGYNACKLLVGVRQPERGADRHPDIGSGDQEPPLRR